jgi:hypothetical protein
MKKCTICNLRESERNKVLDSNETVNESLYAKKYVAAWKKINKDTKVCQACMAKILKSYDILGKKAPEAIN